MQQPTPTLELMRAANTRAHRASVAKMLAHVHARQGDYIGAQVYADIAKRMDRAARRIVRDLIPLVAS